MENLSAPQNSEPVTPAQPAAVTDVHPSGSAVVLRNGYTYAPRDGDFERAAIIPVVRAGGNGGNDVAGVPQFFGAQRMSEAPSRIVISITLGVDNGSSPIYERHDSLYALESSARQLGITMSYTDGHGRSSQGIVEFCEHAGGIIALAQRGTAHPEHQWSQRRVDDACAWHRCESENDLPYVIPSGRLLTSVVCPGRRGEIMAICHFPLRDVSAGDDLCMQVCINLPSLGERKTHRIVIPRATHTPDLEVDNSATALASATPTAFRLHELVTVYQHGYSYAVDDDHPRRVVAAPTASIPHQTNENGTHRAGFFGIRPVDGQPCPVAFSIVLGVNDGTLPLCEYHSRLYTLRTEMHQLCMTIYYEDSHGRFSRGLIDLSGHMGGDIAPQQWGMEHLRHLWDQGRVDGICRWCDCRSGNSTPPQGRLLIGVASPGTHRIIIATSHFSLREARADEDLDLHVKIDLTSLRERRLHHIVIPGAAHATDHPRI